MTSNVSFNLNIQNHAIVIFTMNTIINFSHFLFFFSKGLAVYTGKETKMALNQKEKTYKFSTIEK